ncbi:MAG: DUF2786 domain-containing protein [Candidatus Xenobia bacterium]
MEREKVIDKVRKLLAKAADPCNVHEAAASAAAAQRLMLAHKIEQMELHQDDDEEPIEAGEVFHDGQDPAFWQSMLLANLCQINGCTALKVDQQLVIVGVRSDASAVAYLFRAVSSQIRWLSDRWASNRDFARSVYSQSAEAVSDMEIRAFRLGAAWRVVQRLRGERRRFEGSSAMVLVDRNKARADAWVRDHVGDVNVDVEKPEEASEKIALVHGAIAGSSIRLTAEHALDDGEWHRRTPQLPSGIES